MSLWFWQLFPDGVSEEQTDPPKHRNWTGNPNPKPYRCPRCEGSGWIWYVPGGCLSSAGNGWQCCPACGGTGVLWG